MTASESFPERLKAFRQQKGWTQRELAKTWAYAFATVSAWERGERIPGVHQIPHLAKLMQVTTEEMNDWIQAAHAQTHNQKKTPGAHPQAEPQTWQHIFDAQDEIWHIYRNRAEFSSGFSYLRMFEHAQQVLGVGISLNALVQNYSNDKVISAILEQRTTFTLCFLDPHGYYCREREREEQITPGIISGLTSINIAQMQWVHQHISNKDTESASRLQLLMYNVCPRFNIYIVDDTLMTVQAYGYGLSENVPIYVLKRKRNDGIFEYYASVTHYILARTTPIQNSPA